MKNFISVIGDKPLDQVDRDDMLYFRQWWMVRLAGGEVSANSANKEIGHLSSILQTVNEGKRLGLTLPIGKLALKEGEQRARPPFGDEWIRDKLLKPEAPAGLNSEARNILLTMVNTGARPSELPRSCLATSILTQTFRRSRFCPWVDTSNPDIPSGRSR